MHHQVKGAELIDEVVEKPQLFQRELIHSLERVT